MDINDYARLRDVQENASGRPVGHPFCRVAVKVRRVRIAGRSRGKVGPDFGTDMGPQGSTAGDYSRRISQSAERQYFGRLDAAERSYSARMAGEVADVLADWAS